MKPFTYVLPKTLAEASEEAGKKPDTVLKGAGIDLVDRMKERLQTPTHVVNLLPLQTNSPASPPSRQRRAAHRRLTTLTQLEQHQALATPALAGLRIRRPPPRRRRCATAPPSPATCCSSRAAGTCAAKRSTACTAAAARPASR
jgi:hypothetical protein